MSSEQITTEYGPISADFQTAKLSELCVEKIGVQTGPFGSQLHQEDYVEIGTPIITVEHLGENRILHDNTPFVSDADRDRLSRYSLQEGDIVFSRVGSVDRRSLVRKAENGWLFSGRCLRVRAKRDLIDPIYLSYFFGHEGFKNYLRSIAVGATMPSINTKILSDVPIYFPELEVQKRIGKILLEIDDKIELNRQINQTLEQIAQTIFKSWFVDFEPVKAKIEAKAAGRDPERAGMCAISGKLEPELDQLSSEHYQQLAATAALFPDELVESELGLIPEGWGGQRLENLLDLCYGKSLTKTERRDGDFPVYGSGGITGFHDKPLVAGPGIIVGRKGTVGALYWEDRDFFAIDTVFYVVPKNGATFEVLFYLLQTLGLEKMNTDAAVPGLNRNNVYRLPVPKYPKELMEVFSKTVGIVRGKISCGLCENKTFATLRDTLLPKLLCGELNFIEEVA
ncbi:restriction endonuclease subunit S [Desulfuromonas sp. KJ2020]|uniref:restriction endonuclease subunit S n=1 Tax=Desulfuromonas sp. KJ2020 TaxID=2919173 RepID=UPI0020A71D4D|nr:restriction endonuclease subunit S [Desulfuromonas sp. KJ2020]MCP3177443.1 restriction endonuclease subunit S [Desulfuromonas sp. KJ2020]